MTRETYTFTIRNERGNLIDTSVYQHPAISDMLIVDISSEDHQYEMIITHKEAVTLNGLLTQFFDDRS